MENMEIKSIRGVKKLILILALVVIILSLGLHIFVSVVGRNAYQKIQKNAPNTIPVSCMSDFERCVSLPKPLFAQKESKRLLFGPDVFIKNHKKHAFLLVQEPASSGRLLPIKYSISDQCFFVRMQYCFYLFHDPDNTLSDFLEIDNDSSVEVKN